MDLLWSDPTTNDGVQGVQPSPRGPGLVTFGPDRVKEFCKVRRRRAALLGRVWGLLRACCACGCPCSAARLPAGSAQPRQLLHPTTSSPPTPHHHPTSPPPHPLLPRRTTGCR
jgi:hypothetical protein